MFYYICMYYIHYPLIQYIYVKCGGLMWLQYYISIYSLNILGVYTSDRILINFNCNNSNMRHYIPSIPTYI